MKREARSFGRGLKEGVKAELAPRFDVANFDKQMASSRAVFPGQGPD